MYEVYAYYKGEKNALIADEGTRLRFVESASVESRLDGNCSLPGITLVDAEFHSSHPAYFDHWVSNGKSNASVLYFCYFHGVVLQLCFRYFQQLSIGLGS